MSVIRQEMTTQDWVIIAPNRRKRPHDRALVQDVGPATGYDPPCPFCPGNEALTPPERFRISDGLNGWAVRVVPNKFGVLTPEEVPQDREEGPLFHEMFHPFGTSGGIRVHAMHEMSSDAPAGP